MRRKGPLYPITRHRATTRSVRVPHATCSFVSPTTPSIGHYRCGSKVSLLCETACLTFPGFSRRCLRPEVPRGAPLAAVPQTLTAWWVARHFPPAAPYFRVCLTPPAHLRPRVARTCEFARATRKWHYFPICAARCGQFWSPPAAAQVSCNCN